VPSQNPIAIDRTSAPFDRYRGIRWLAPARSGHDSHEHARHQLYVGTGKDNPVHVLIKVTSKPGLVYERDLGNEIATLDTINRDLPASRYFPFVYEHGHLDDGRLYLIMSLFDEFPLATIVNTEPVGGRLVAHLMTTIAVARALAEIHTLDIFHVDLNPMNILYRTERGLPVIRIVDFESSYERSRHTKGTFYNPPTTPGYTAPEVARQAPDARSDVFSLGAVLHTLLAGDLWVAPKHLAARIESDDTLDAELREALLTAVALDPADRYRSVTAFRLALEVYLERIWPGRAW
jgi:serine/threonine protein kinase